MNNHNALLRMQIYSSTMRILSTTVEINVDLDMRITVVAILIALLLPLLFNYLRRYFYRTGAHE